MRLLLVALAAALAAGAAQSASASAAPPPGFFGVVPSSLTPSDVSRMAQNGVSTVRLGVNWAAVEPRPGPRNYASYDTAVGNLAAARIRALPLLLGAPLWVSPKRKPPIFTAAQRQGWTSFMAELAARYGHNGSFWRAHPELPYEPWEDWEVWNEPNLRGYWGGKPKPKQMVRLLRLTRSGLNRSDPAARIGIGGIFPPPRPRYGISLRTFLNGVYRVRGARSAFDAVAIHPYASRPKGVLSATREARKIMNHHGDRGTPLWITEVGWTTSGTHWRRSPFRATEPQQARFLGKTFRRLLAARQALGLEHVIWYAWQDAANPNLPFPFYTGLLRGDGTAKPALGTYARVATGG